MHIYAPSQQPYWFGPPQQSLSKINCPAQFSRIYLIATFQHRLILDLPRLKDSFLYVPIFICMKERTIRYEFLPAF